MRNHPSVQVNEDLSILYFYLFLQRICSPKHLSCYCSNWRMFVIVFWLLILELTACYCNLLCCCLDFELGLLDYLLFWFMFFMACLDLPIFFCLQSQIFVEFIILYGITIRRQVYFLQFLFVDV